MALNFLRKSKTALRWEGMAKQKKLQQQYPFLASLDVSFVTGAILTVDGGQNA